MFPLHAQTFLHIACWMKNQWTKASLSPGPEWVGRGWRWEGWEGERCERDGGEGGRERETGAEHDRTKQTQHERKTYLNVKHRRCNRPLYLDNNIRNFFLFSFFLRKRGGGGGGGGGRRSRAVFTISFRRGGSLLYSWWRCLSFRGHASSLTLSLSFSLLLCVYVSVCLCLFSLACTSFFFTLSLCLYVSLSFSLVFSSFPPFFPLLVPICPMLPRLSLFRFFCLCITNMSFSVSSYHGTHLCVRWPG